ncbi:flavin reductase family protein [Roseomonas chloroacetimidivorans]|uniref:flavin reductase family protein n=1 Tax=Roseomonas chloroacetimidivorans TaxID=1766656 RepID=UPI003C766958
MFRANGILCVNTLSGVQQDISAVFAGATKCPVEERFETGRWGTLLTGAPVLEDAVVSFDCRIADLVEKGTHTVFFAEVVAVRHSGQDAGLVYFRRNYHRVGPDLSLAQAA